MGESGGGGVMAKYVVPEGMLQAAQSAYKAAQSHNIEPILEAALRWQAENSVKPSEKQIREIQDYLPGCGPATLMDQWVRQMWLAPEPETPVAIEDLLLPKNVESGFSKVEVVNQRLREAYRRGRVEALQESLAEMLRREGGEK